MKQLLTYRDVVEITSTSIQTVKRWSNDGTLHPLKLGKRKRGALRDNRAVRFKLSEVAKLVGESPNELGASLKASLTREAE